MLSFKYIHTLVFCIKRKFCLIENNEKQKKAKDMKHAKTTVSPPKAEYKTNSESSTNHLSACKTFLFCMILSFLK